MVVVGNEIRRRHYEGADGEGRERLDRQVDWTLARFVRRPFEEAFRDVPLVGPIPTMDGLLRVGAGPTAYLLKDDRIVAEEREVGTGKAKNQIRVEFDTADVGGGYGILAERYAYTSPTGRIKTSRRLELRRAEGALPAPERSMLSTDLPGGDRLELTVTFGKPAVNREDPVTIDAAARELLAAAWKRRYVLPDSLRLEAEFARKLDRNLARTGWMKTVRGMLQVWGMEQISIELDERLFRNRRWKDDVTRTCTEHATWFFGMLRAVPFEKAFEDCGFVLEEGGVVRVYGSEEFVAFRIEEERIAAYLENGAEADSWWELAHKTVDREKRFLITRMNREVEDEKYALRFQYARKKGLHVPKSYEVFVQPSDPTRAPVHGVVEYELKRAKVSLPR